MRKFNLSLEIQAIPVCWSNHNECQSGLLSLYLEVSDLVLNVNWPRLYLKSLDLVQYQLFFLVISTLFKKVNKMGKEDESSSLWAKFD